VAGTKEVLKALVVSVVAHTGYFRSRVPWLLLGRTSDAPQASVSLGPAPWLGPAVIVFGVYLYVGAVVRLLSRNTSAVPGQLPSVLETDGWYARSRHPLLLGWTCTTDG